MRDEAELDAAATAIGAHLEQSLLDTWSGVAWLKPAITDCEQWVRAAVARFQTGEIAAALILLPGRTDTEYAQHAMRHAPMVCLIRGRVRFTGRAGGAPFPSLVAYIGPNPTAFKGAFKKFGIFV